MKASENERKEPPMNTWKVADAVVRRLEGDVVTAPGVRTYEGALQLLEDLATEPRVRDDVGGWAR